MNNLYLDTLNLDELLHDLRVNLMGALEVEVHDNVDRWLAETTDLSDGDYITLRDQLHEYVAKHLVIDFKES
jgi:hypothetical protein